VSSEDPKARAAEARAELRKAEQERAARSAGVPSLHLIVWPTVDCLRLSLVIYRTVPGMRRTCEVIRSAAWQPREVSERRLVEWAHRACADWLADAQEGAVFTELPWSR
jgi:hypothetical protein